LITKFQLIIFNVVLKLDKSLADFSEQLNQWWGEIHICASTTASYQVVTSTVITVFIKAISNLSNSVNVSRV